MKSEKSIHKASLKAKIVFILLPVIALLLIELLARLFVPVDNSPDLVTEQVSLLYKPSADKYTVKEDVLKRNYEEIVRNGRMLGLPIHKREKDCFYVLVPGVDFSFRKPGSYIVDYKINSLGFRDEEFPVEKDKNKLRIICAGDSSTFGYFVNLYDTYPARLRTMLQINTAEKNAEVINAGVLAYSSFQGVSFFEKYLRRLKPDILIVSYGYNDSYLGNLPDYLFKMESSKTIWMKKLFKISAAYRLFDSILAPSPRDNSSIRNIPRVNLEEYKKNYEKLYSMCKEDGIHLVLLPISVPVPYQKILSEFAKEKNCDYIDTEATLQEDNARFLKEGYTSYKGIKFGPIIKRTFDNYHRKRFGSVEMTKMRQFNYLFIDYCHPTPAGYDIIAECIYEYLIKHGFFTKAKGTLPTPPDIWTPALKPVKIPPISK
jgi:lysophospholipase L1-like esterase